MAQAECLKTDTETSTEELLSKAETRDPHHTLKAVSCKEEEAMKAEVVEETTLNLKGRVTIGNEK